MITQQEYQARRQTLALRLPKDSIAFIPAARERLRNGDVHYPFRQCSDFYYLTGFNEPDALLIIMGGQRGGVSILFTRPCNPLQEQWTGQRLGPENAPAVLGVDAAYAIDLLAGKLPEFLQGKHAIYALIGRSSYWDKCILQAWKALQAQVRSGSRTAEVFCDLSPLLSEMRLFKSEAEIACMRRAAEISVLAHKRAMQTARYAHHEYALEAEIRYELIRHGCRHLAYESIVAGGHNARVLHYTANNQPLKSGELVLIDAGGEWDHYAADITRVFPPSGQFSTDQRLIYGLVLRAQKAGIACIKPGIRWNVIQQTMVKVLTEGLVELGLLQGCVSDLVDKEAYRVFYMHSSGHWLGLDVHDCGRYKIQDAWRLLEPGMVLTVEPGIYIQAGLHDVAPRWWGIGVRIEDDILVTAEGHENLTVALPVDVDEIEACVRG